MPMVRWSLKIGRAYGDVASSLRFRYFVGTGLASALMRWRWWRSLNESQRYLVSNQSRMSDDWVKQKNRRG
jgi:hypothetical protein